MDRVRIGVVGCGAIAQVHHLPNLADLAELFDVTMVCDISPKTAEYAANRWHVPDFVTDYRELIASDVDAVLHCARGAKTQEAVTILEAGKHLFIEKPMCASLQEADEIISARQRSGKVGQVGYMKVYDPAFEYAKREVDEMDDIQFVQVNHLHCDNALHTGQLHVELFDDAPGDFLALQDVAMKAARKQAIGDVAPPCREGFSQAVRKHDPRYLWDARFARATNESFEYRDLERRTSCYSHC